MFTIITMPIAIKMQNLKRVAVLLLHLFVSCLVFSQQSILTAAAFFQSVSENYGKMRDYEAAIKIVQGKTEMSGKVSFKRPNLLRIDFSDPASQVIVFNGELLTIYLPGVRAILNQTVTTSGSASAGPTLATPQGLSLMNRYYTIAYETGQTPVPLNANSSEMVIKLVLNRKNTSEGFRNIKLSVQPETLLIRRIEAQTINDEHFSFDFESYALNQNIPDTRFIYDAPSSANNFNNFLYTE